MSRIASAHTVFTADDARLQSAIRANISSLQGFGARLTTFSRIGVAAFAAIGGAAAGIALGRKFVKMAEEQEQADRKLAASLLTTGNATGFTFQQLKLMAEQLQQVTQFEDSTVEGAQSVLASFENIRGDVFRRALVSAADLASFMGIDLVTAAENVGRALNDPAEGFARLGREGVRFTKDEQDDIKRMIAFNNVAGAQNAILDKLAGRFKGQATDAAKSFGGSVDVMKHQLGEAGETIGSALMPALAALIEPLAAVARIIEQNSGSIIAWGRGFAETVRSIMQPAIIFLVQAFAAVETAVLSAKDVMDLAVNAMALTFVAGFNLIANRIAFVVDNVKWFANVVLEILKQLALNAVVIFSNVIDNIKTFTEVLKTALQGGTAAGALDLSLRGGFKNLLQGGIIATDPKIFVPPTLKEGGPVEDALKDRVADLTDNVMASWENRWKNRAAKLNFLLQPFGAGVDLDKIGGAAGAVDKPFNVSQVPFKSSIEGLKATFNRIQAAAASEPATDGVIKAVNGVKEQQVFSLGVLNQIRQLIADTKAGLPLVGTFGR